MAPVAIDPRVSGRTADFVQKDHRMLIDGRFVAAAAGQTFPVYNPATGDVITRVPEAESEDVDRAVRAARRAFDERAWRMCPWPWICSATWAAGPPRFPARPCPCRPATTFIPTRCGNRSA